MSQGDDTPATAEWLDGYAKGREDEHGPICATQDCCVARERDRLREALAAAVYFADNLERVMNHKPVRDLAESRAAFVKARAVLEERVE